MTHPAGLYFLAGEHNAGGHLFEDLIVELCPTVGCDGFYGNSLQDSLIGAKKPFESLTNKLNNIGWCLSVVLSLLMNSCPL
jgi:hypothetical protein